MGCTLRLTSCPASDGSLLILLWLISKVSKDGIKVNYEAISKSGVRVKVKRTTSGNTEKLLCLRLR